MTGKSRAGAVSCVQHVNYALDVARMLATANREHYLMKRGRLEFFCGYPYKFPCDHFRGVPVTTIDAGENSALVGNKPRAVAHARQLGDYYYPHQVVFQPESSYPVATSAGAAYPNLPNYPPNYHPNYPPNYPSNYPPNYPPNFPPNYSPNYHSYYPPNGQPFHPTQATPFTDEVPFQFTKPSAIPVMMPESDEAVPNEIASVPFGQELDTTGPLDKAGVPSSEKKPILHVVKPEGMFNMELMRKKLEEENDALKTRVNWLTQTLRQNEKSREEIPTASPGSKGRTTNYTTS